MAFKSYRNVFVASTGTILSSGTTTNLGVGQIGIFDTKKYQAQTAPVYNTVPEIIIAQGTPDRSVLPDGAALGNETYKTVPINGKYVTNWTVQPSQRPQGRIITLGYDGVNANKTLFAKPGDTKTFWLKLSGQPILNFFPDQRRYLVEQFTITLPCASDCVDNCATTVDCNIIADAILAQFYAINIEGTYYNGRKTVGGQLLSKYVKASKLINCGTPSGYTTVPYTQWTLVIPDNGHQNALGIVQAQYPGFVITRTSYIDGLSTYIVTLPAASGTPAVFDNQANSIIPNCTTCPSGYTLTSLLYTFTVSRTDNGSSGALTTLKSNYGDTNAIRLSYQFGSSLYEIHSTTTPVTAFQAGDVVSVIGTQESVCVLTAPGTTTAWSTASPSGCTQAITSFQITLQNPACGGTNLAALTAAYASYGSVYNVSANTATCTAVYGINIHSDQTNCDTCDIQAYTFTAPPAFGGVEWVEVDGNIYGTSCVCGVKFESAYVARQSQECFFDSVPYESDPLFIEVSERNPDLNDFSTLCFDTWPVTLLQEVKYPAGNGRFVATLERLSREYFNDYWRPDPAERDMLLYHFFTDLDQYYDEYILTWDLRSPEGSFARHKKESFEFHFFFPETTGGQFATILNSWLSSSAIQIPPVTI